MKQLHNVVRRNLKLFFKDKGMFISALITPMILLVLYATFLARLYRQSFAEALPPGVSVPDKLIDGTVASQLIAALLAVCCVTIAFCANLLMIQDRANGSIRDFTVTPIRRSQLAAGYYVASAASTLIITFSALAVCLVYLVTQGWYLSTADLLLVCLDVFLLTLFGTALSSCINFFLHTNGQASAVGTIISAGYGFICGAYMPIASFGEGLRNVLAFLPGTYGTSLLKEHMMRGCLSEMEASGFPPAVMTGIRDGVDVNLYFFGNHVSAPMKLAVTALSVLFFTGLFVIFQMLRKNEKSA